MADEKKPSAIAAALAKLGKGKPGSGGTPKGGETPRTEKIRVRISPEHQKKASRNRWLLVSGVGFALVVLVSVVLSGGGKSKPEQAPKQVRDGIDLTPAGTLRQDFETSAQADLLRLKREAETTKKQQAQTDKTLMDIQHSQIDLKHAIDSLKGQVVSAPTHPTLPPPAQAGIPKPPGTTNAQALPQTPPPLPPPPGTPGEASLPAVPSVPPEPEPIVITPESSTPTAAGSKVGAHTKFAKNPMAGYLPSGSFMPAVMLTGIEAGTAESSQGDPQPVLLRIERGAILPGYARYQVTACFALGSAHGSMSTERAYIRLARISCIDKNKHLVIDAPLKGYAVDSDGMFGLRGKLVERQGALLAKSLLAGFASGLSNALGQAQGTAYTGTFGAGSTISGSSALKGAAFGGGSKAADQLAQFYLKQAQAIFPVVIVKPRRKVTLVLTDGASLKWNDYGSLYIKTTTPEK